MDNPQKELRKKLEAFVKQTTEKRGSVPPFGTYPQIDDDTMYYYADYILVSPKNAELVREAIEKRKKLMDSPLWKVLND